MESRRNKQEWQWSQTSSGTMNPCQRAQRLSSPDHRAGRKEPTHPEGHHRSHDCGATERHETYRRHISPQERADRPRLATHNGQGARDRASRTPAASVLARRCKPASTDVHLGITCQTKYQRINSLCHSLHEQRVAVAVYRFGWVLICRWHGLDRAKPSDQPEMASITIQPWGQPGVLLNRPARYLPEHGMVMMMATRRCP